MNLDVRAARKTTRPILRLLGVLLGVVYLAFGPYVIFLDHGLTGIWHAIPFVVLGFMFLRYGISGPGATPTLATLPVVLRRLLGYGVGAFLCAFGAYELFTSWRQPVWAIVLFVLFETSGISTLWLLHITRRVGSAA